MATIDNADETSKVRSYVTDLEKAFNSLGICPRTFQRYPFDSVALGILAKAFALAKACLTLLETGFADEAFGLSRSLVECGLTLRFLTQDRGKLFERTDRYMRFVVADKQYWMHWALQNSKGSEEQDILDYGKQYDLTPDPKKVMKHWSGKDGFAWKVNLEDHPLDGAITTESFKKSSYAVDYHQTSSYVHCYIPAVENLLPDLHAPFEIGCTVGKAERSSRATLYITICNLHSCAAYALFGLNLDRPESLNNLFSEALKSMKGIQRPKRRWR